MNVQRFASLSGRVWRQLLVPFAVSLLSLAGVMLANQMLKQRPFLLRAGASPGDMLRLAVLSVPFIIAMTLPMAVLIAVMWIFVRRTERGRVLLLKLPDATPHRLVLAVVAAGVIVGGLSLVWNNAVLPESNYQLRLLLLKLKNPQADISASASEEYRGDREMSIAAMRRVVTSAKMDEQLMTLIGDSTRVRAARKRAATYAVEIQKKYAMAAACAVFALFAAGLGLRVRGGGWRLIGVVCLGVFCVYYVALIGGEELGDRLIISPFWAMWSANVLLAAIALPLVWGIMTDPTWDETYRRAR